MVKQMRQLQDKITYGLLLFKVCFALFIANLIFSEGWLTLIGEDGDLISATTDIFGTEVKSLRDPTVDSAQDD